MLTSRNAPKHGGTIIVIGILTNTNNLSILKIERFSKEWLEELNTNSSITKLMKLSRRMDLGNSCIGLSKENFQLLKLFDTIINPALNYLIYEELSIVPSTLLKVDKLT